MQQQEQIEEAVVNSTTSKEKIPHAISEEFESLVNLVRESYAVVDALVEEVSFKELKRTVKNLMRHPLEDIKIPPAGSKELELFKVCDLIAVSKYKAGIEALKFDQKLQHEKALAEANKKGEENV